MAKTHDLGVMSGRGKLCGRSASIGKVYYSHFGVTIIAPEKIHERSAPVKGMAKTHDLLFGALSGR